MLNSLITESPKRSSSEPAARDPLARPPPLLMNPTVSTKPKAKFSSRNLNAAFKAPLRTKPLPDHAAGPLQRPNNRLLVLGRAAVAAPAPLNTPSLKRESQVDDIPVSLVPAGSNWAEKQQNVLEDEAPEHPPAPADVVAPTVASEKAWTPESVAEHLHTGNAPARLETKIESSGRWGDDAVENDIVQSNIRRQMQKEREFPDLKEAAEETQMHHGQGHTSPADRSPSMGPQQSGQQHHGRATGRWAQFAEQGEMHHSIQDDRWSQDRYGRDEDDRWSRDRYGRGEDNHWARGRYNRDEDDRWSRGRCSRHDDGYGRERRPYESSNNTVSPIPDDNHTHFSSSDARFDMVASGDQDRVLSHSPHRMNWGSRQFGRWDGRSSSPTSLERPPFHEHHADRTLNQSSSTSSAPVMAADTKAMNWHKISSPEHRSDRGSAAPRQPANPWSKDEEPTTPVAEAAESSTESSNSSTSSSPNQHQVQLLKRPKMLFDPKTGGMVKAEEKTDPPARQTGSRNGSKNRDPTPATKRNGGKHKAVYKASTASAAKTEGSEEAPASCVHETTSKDAECSSEVSSVVPSNAEPNTDIAEDKPATKENRASKRLTKKQATGNPEESGFHGAKFPRDSKAGASRSTQHSKHSQGSQESAVNAREGSRLKERSKRNSSTRNDRRDAGTSKSTQRRFSRKVELTTVQTPAVVPSDIAVLKQIADGSSGGVVVVTDQQEGIEVNPESGGFETVKSRRTVLSEKKKLRQKLASSDAVVSKVEEKKPTHAFAAKNADEQSKGEQVQETFGLTTSAAQAVSKSRGQTANARSHEGQTPKDKKPRAKQQKYPTRTSGTKKPPTNSDKPVYSDGKQPWGPPKAVEQVPGEAPTETAVARKRPQYVKVSPVTEPKQEQKHRREKPAQRNSSSSPSERKSSAGSTRKQEPEGKRVVEKVFTTKPRASATKLKPKQVRQVYVVKTPAPVSATSTAA